MPKTVTRKQLGLLLSKNSPLSPTEKRRFKREVERGDVTVKKKKSTRKRKRK